MNSRVRLLVHYEGTRYHGWQIQPDQTTVQETIEQAYYNMTGFRARIMASGRTDSGVHAAGQVVCLNNPSRHDPEALLRGLNAWLPDDIVILAANAVSNDFNPRKHAVGKHYRYNIHNHPVRPVFERAFRWHVRRSLDHASMNQAVAHLIGEQDFSAFRASGCEAKSPIRRVDFAFWTLKHPLLRLDIFGNGFLKQMVRNIVGTCVEAGYGRIPPQQIKSILKGKDRRLAGPTSPARGLCLLRVYYAESEYLKAISDIK